MKIVVSAKGAGAESAMDARFGRAAGFAVWDSGSGEWGYESNGVEAAAAHGAGIQAAERVCGMGAEVVISGHVGPKAYKVLAAGGVKAYRAEAGTVGAVVERYERGELKEIREEDAV